MNRSTQLALGLITFLAALWGGTYLLHQYQGRWQEVPTFVSAFIVGFAGFMLSAWTLSSWNDAR